MVRHLAYGTWPSPLTAPVAAAAGARLAGPFVAGDALCWVEGRPSEGGRSVLVAASEAGAVTDQIPEDWNVRSAVHEYGGGAAWADAEGRRFCVRWSDQAVWCLDPEPTRVTPQAPEGEQWRFADGSVSPSGALAVVREVHTPGEISNEIVVVADGAIDVIDASADFVACPRWSPDG